MATQSLIHLTISNVSEQLFDGEVVSVTVPGESGVMTLLAHHEAFITLLKAGTVIVTPANGGERREFRVKSGALETSNNQITILV